ncbi:hypothetical protein AHAS_Ahas14G0024900 [Arachis hypogaea]
MVKEVRKQICLAGPLIMVNLLNFAIELISIMFVGHVRVSSLWRLHGHLLFLCQWHWFSSQFFLYLLIEFFSSSFPL